MDSHDISEQQIKQFYNQQSDNKLNPLSVQILIEEFKHLHDLYLRQRVKRSERVNFFVGLVTAVGAGLIIATQSKMFDRFALIYLGLITLTLLSIFGVMIHGNLIGNDINSDNYIRGMNRIKRYFTDRDKDLTEYFIFPPIERPVLLTLRLTSIAVIVQFLTATLFSTVAVIFQFLFFQTITFLQGFITVLIIAGITIFSLNRWAKKELQKAIEKYQTRSQS